MITFKNEAQFEQAFIEVLTNKGWEPEILKTKPKPIYCKIGLPFYLKTIASGTA